VFQKAYDLFLARRGFGIKNTSSQRFAKYERTWSVEVLSLWGDAACSRTLCNFQMLLATKIPPH